MMDDVTNGKRVDIFSQFPPGANRRTTAVRYPDPNGERLGYAYAEAARKVVAGFSGAPAEDALLLPFLYLFRHGFELDLKYAIVYATALRRAAGQFDLEPASGGTVVDRLVPAEVRKRLKAKLGHRLVDLLDELDRHLAALGLGPCPREVRRCVEWLNAADPGGVSFRYGDDGRIDGEVPVNLTELASALDEAHDMLASVPSVLESFEECLAEDRAVVAEYEFEMRDLYFDDWS